MGLCVGWPWILPVNRRLAGLKVVQVADLLTSNRRHRWVASSIGVGPRREVRSAGRYPPIAH